VEQWFAPEAPTPRAIGTTGVETGVEVTLESDARPREGSARFTVGRETWEVEAPGVYMLTLPPAGPPRRWRTGDARWAADHFARAIADLPAGTPAAVAISGHGTKFFTPAVQAALESLGAGQRLTGASQEAYVLLGVKGAPAGTALEERAPQGRASLVFGRSLDERAVGVAWGRLELERAEP
jgi:hypothetical protein